jgi:hypothetical protein
MFNSTLLGPFSFLSLPAILTSSYLFFSHRTFFLSFAAPFLLYLPFHVPSSLVPSLFLPQITIFFAFFSVLTLFLPFSFLHLTLFPSSMSHLSVFLLFLPKIFLYTPFHAPSQSMCYILMSPFFFFHTLPCSFRSLPHLTILLRLLVPPYRLPLFPCSHLTLFLISLAIFYPYPSFPGPILPFSLLSRSISSSSFLFLSDPSFPCLILASFSILSYLQPILFPPFPATTYPLPFFSCSNLSSLFLSLLQLIVFLPCPAPTYPLFSFPCHNLSSSFLSLSILTLFNPFLVLFNLFISCPSPNLPPSLLFFAYFTPVFGQYYNIPSFTCPISALSYLPTPIVVLYTLPPSVHAFLLQYFKIK